MNPEEIRKSIEIQFKKILSDDKLNTISGFNKQDAYGHAAGTQLEDWVKINLIQNGWNAYFPNEFLNEIFKRVGSRRASVEFFLKGLWWTSLLISKKQVDAICAGKLANRWQQEGADIVLFYGNDLIKDCEDVILINVKSHDITRSSRPPNIMSAQRLLQFFNDILNKDPGKINQVELWFLGVDYSVTDIGAKIGAVHIKDMFKINVAAIPQINFDAAIQIQYHVRDMEIIDQNKITFIRQLSDSFIMQWRTHSKNKEEKYEKLVSNIRRVCDDLG